MKVLTALVDDILACATSRNPDLDFSIQLSDAVSLLLPHDVDHARLGFAGEVGTVPVPLHYRGHPIIASPFITDDMVRIEAAHTPGLGIMIRYTGLLSTGQFCRTT